MELTVKAVKDYNGKVLFHQFEQYTEDMEKEKLIVDCPLWYHKKNLMYNSTGYGRKIPTSKKLKYNNRLYRIYVCIFSNSGSTYIVSKGKAIYFN